LGGDRRSEYVLRGGEKLIEKEGKGIIYGDSSFQDRQGGRTMDVNGSQIRAGKEAQSF